LLDERNATDGIEECTQALVQQAHTSRWKIGLRNPARQQGRQPIETQGVAHWCALADPGDKFVLLARKHRWFLLLRPDTAANHFPVRVGHKITPTSREERVAFAVQPAACFAGIETSVQQLIKHSPTGRSSHNPSSSA